MMKKFVWKEVHPMGVLCETLW